MSTPSRVTQAILRIGAGLLFFEHGLQKLFGLLGGFGAPGATAPMMSRFGVAGVLEFFGGLLMAFGLFTRPTAAILAIEMSVALLTVHFPGGPIPVLNGGELPMLYALIWLFFATHGAG